MRAYNCIKHLFSITEVTVIMPDRDVLHSDINCCYAQIECQARPELRGKPVVVGGDEEARHGIVLAKNLIAKRAGVKTAMALWRRGRHAPARRRAP